MQQEQSLVNTIVEQPNSRMAFVNLARFYEAEGRNDDASIVFRGHLPKPVRIKYGLGRLESQSTEAMSGCSTVSRMPPQNAPLTSPVNDDAERASIFLKTEIACPGDKVDVLESATLLYDGMNQLYLNAENFQHTEHSTVNAYLLHARALSPGVLRKTLSGLTLLLAARNDHNFYHWHFDLMPKLHLLESCGIKLNEIDNILVNEKLLSFHHETLAALGIQDSQLVPVDHSAQPLDCEHLILPKVTNRMGMASSPRHLEWLRGKFLTKDILLQKPRRKLAIYREQRGFTDTENVFMELEKRGYERFKPEELSYAGQVASFAGATDIVSPHGAALTLLAYCRPNTRVHEFYGAHVHPCFWAISSNLNHRYANYNCAGEAAEASAMTNKGLQDRLRQSVNLTPERISLTDL